jgi:hypothetical protein
MKANTFLRTSSPFSSTSSAIDVIELFVEFSTNCRQSKTELEDISQRASESQMVRVGDEPLRNLYIKYF